VRATAVDDSRPSAVRAVRRPRAIAGSSSRTAPADLRALALAGLPQMFDREAGIFSFRVRRGGRAIVREGVSRRYTAITLIGLAGEAPAAAREVLGGRSVAETADALARSAGARDSIGDLALIAWACSLAGGSTKAVWRLIEERQPEIHNYPTVEVAWALSAAVADGQPHEARLREALASRLRDAMSLHGIFPHALVRPADRPEATAAASSRAHVSCFADLVYPVLALSQHATLTGDPASTACAVKGAAAMCRLQGAEGQWWWHFDYRTGRVLERYPVYAVHQDSMAPMALFAASRAGGRSYDSEIAKGLRWLASAPELGGASLVDRTAGIVWRKVARREPGKLSRYVQAGASRLSPALRAPGLDVLFPPRAIDYEDRAYHLGWVLYTWPAERAAEWS
jgi:hypothetical protein